MALAEDPDVADLRGRYHAEAACGTACAARAMSAPGRPKGEFRSAQREGCLMSALGLQINPTTAAA